MELIWVLKYISIKKIKKIKKKKKKKKKKNYTENLEIDFKRRIRRIRFEVPKKIKTFLAHIFVYKLNRNKICS
jgi:hypothetical protein